MTLQLVGLTNGERHELAGHFVVAYDPEAHEPDGSYIGGILATTLDAHAATRFSIEEAFKVWRSGPTCACHRLRPDGEVNRPLTSFNVEIAGER